MKKKTKKIPAPWSLTGNGYIFIYKFPDEFKKSPFFRISLSDRVASGFGTIMLVDYEKSDAGPYRELLFIPGEFDYLYKKFYSITKIYVSTKESVDNGRANWGIPKELADFEAIRIDKRRERIIVRKDGTIVFDAILKKRSIPFRVSTRYFSHALVQKLEGKTVFFTEFNGAGRGRLATLESLYCNPHYFPEVCSLKPIAVTAVEDFRITFPVAATLFENT
ncbi:MAG TPA: acetoacetate decarboxylase family protein [Spirochaetota bacterium]|nr:acetoacetate decarboxylase family protein [Spirochaetota bacterium]HPC41593.1 acetoacetate decarboxylase family protein [Spirochaetota bacterium]HPL15388.1 acetoacetate decarboxylase family protein [Spirochaetota bacterium]HQF08297.1 acetoacetate decarboxylase family protein [Spirochaetota bacterium]HQH97088.1 acetoacetate decarboxylase family protein [Spirochaetota bacterium]